MSARPGRTLIVDDLDYRPLLSLPSLQHVRVMATRGMTPPIEELIERLAKTIPEAVDTLTPDGNMPTDEQLRQRLMPAA